MLYRPILNPELQVINRLLLGIDDKLFVIVDILGINHARTYQVFKVVLFDIAAAAATAAVSEYHLTYLFVALDANRTEQDE